MGRHALALESDATATLWERNTVHILEWACEPITFAQAVSIKTVPFHGKTEPVIETFQDYSIFSERRSLGVAAAAGAAAVLVVVILVVAAVIVAAVGFLVKLSSVGSRGHIGVGVVQQRDVIGKSCTAQKSLRAVEPFVRPEAKRRRRREQKLCPRRRVSPWAGDEQHPPPPHKLAVLAVMQQPF